ncbi:small nuclear ribonucleoprotein [Stagonosporopsis vannaccii]|nr:small nuclear ribonucleoprotein [Stagonosporopsis vannaccii]
MSERGAFRGRGGGGRGDHRGGRGGGRGGAHGGNAAGQQQTERPKKENILDLSKYMDKQITVKFSGGREGESMVRNGPSNGEWLEQVEQSDTDNPPVIGTLKGYDQLMNLVLDEVKEAMTDDEGNVRYRKLGLIVARGTLLVVISPVDGSEEIANPFIQEEE